MPSELLRERFPDEEESAVWLTCFAWVEHVAFKCGTKLLADVCHFIGVDHYGDLLSFEEQHDSQ